MISVNSFGMSDIGKVRTENQDSFLIDKNIGVYIVADGMGGMVDGAKASKFVTNAMKRYIEENFNFDLRKNVRYVIRLLRKGINLVNNELKKTITTKTGSTIVVLVHIDEKFYIANVGDSLAFGIRDDQIIQLTPEHNLAWVLVMLEKLKPEEVKDHPAKHSLTAYMGMEGEIEAYVNIIKPENNDYVLLCSDGLTGMTSQEDIVNIIHKCGDIQTAVKELITKANNAGGTDNITIILLKVTK
ncbi:MAG: protein phosphatase 2C domain-containing protein [Clostridiales bacterium]